jgi:hypothetical protein
MAAAEERHLKVVATSQGDASGIKAMTAELRAAQEAARDLTVQASRAQRMQPVPAVEPIKEVAKELDEVAPKAEAAAKSLKKLSETPVAPDADPLKDLLGEVDRLKKLAAEPVPNAPTARPPVVAPPPVVDDEAVAKMEAMIGKTAKWVGVIGGAVAVGLEVKSTIEGWAKAMDAVSAGNRAAGQEITGISKALLEQVRRARDLEERTKAKADLDERILEVETRLRDIYNGKEKASRQEVQMLQAQLALLVAMDTHFESQVKYSREKVLQAEREAAAMARTRAAREVVADLAPGARERAFEKLPTGEQRETLDLQRRRMLEELQREIRERNVSDGSIPDAAAAGKAVADTANLSAEDQARMLQQATALAELEDRLAKLKSQEEREFDQATREREGQEREAEQEARKAQREKDVQAARKAQADAHKLAREEGELELRAIEARASGQKEVADQLERQLKLQRMARDIAKEQFLRPDEALRQAERRLAAEERVEALEAERKRREKAEKDGGPDIGETGRPLVDGRIDGRARNVDDVPLTATERLARGDRARDVARSEAEAARRRSRDQYASGESGFFSRPDPLADRFSGPDPLDRFRTPPAPPGLTPAPGAAGAGDGGAQVAGGDAMQGAADKVGEAAVVQQAANASLTKASDQAIQAVQGFQEAVTSAIDGVSSAVDSLTRRLETKLGELESKIDAAKNAI